MRTQRSFLSLFRPTLLVELLLFAFLAIFLIYPLVYVLPGAVSDEVYQVNLIEFGSEPRQKAETVALLHKLDLSADEVQHLRLPAVVRAFPIARIAAAED